MSEPTPSGEQRHAGERLLVVEDDPTAAALLARALGRRGYVTATAASVGEALEVSGEGPLRAAIVDLRLGSDSGLRLVPALVNRHPGICVLVLTGYASIATAVQAIKLGAADYLAKPVGVEEILEALDGREAQSREVRQSPPISRPSVRRLAWEYMQKVLAEHDGNVSRTARALGMSRRTLQRKLAKRPVKA